MNIYEKLSLARKDARGHKPEGMNTYSNYAYYTPTQVEDIVAEVCEKHKLFTVCNLKRDEHGLYQELVLINLEDITEKIVFEMATELGEIKATNRTQQMGGTDTYSERYIKMKVFQIKDNNLDFDSKDNRQKDTLKDEDLIL